MLYPQFVRDEAGRRRFAQEARIGAELDSDHVVEVVGAGIDDATGTPWLAMELLEGQDLATYVQSRGRLDAGAVGAVLEQLCDALARAHAKGVVHRDLKPENIFIATARRRGVPFTLKILDFGIAKIVQENRAAATGSMTIGSPLWMAPEQAVTAAPISPRTDVWSLGLIAYWLFAGDWYWTNAPRGAAFNLPALLVEVMTAPLDLATTRMGTAGGAGLLPSGFDAWFARCVNRDPAARFADAGAAFDALAGMLSGGAPSHETIPLRAPPTPPTGTTPMSPRSIPPDELADPRTAQRPVAPSKSRWIAGALALVGVMGIIVPVMLLSQPTVQRSSAAAPEPTPLPTPLPPLQESPPQPRPHVDAPPVASPPVANRDPSPSVDTRRGTPRTSPPRQPAPRDNPNRETDATGSMDPREFSRVYNQNRAQISDCYSRASVGGDVQGIMVLRVRVSIEGRVASTRVISNSTHSRALERCVQSAVRGWTYSRPDGGDVEVDYPMRFGPGQ